ncbi:MAG: AAA family ATPase [Chitinophagaceae bacterium]
MENLFTQRVIDANNVFNSFFLDTKKLYLHCFNRLPSVSFIDNVDGEKAFSGFLEKYGQQIRNVYHNKLYRRKKKKFEFDRTVVEMNNNVIAEFDEGWCEILHDGADEGFIHELAMWMNHFKERQRRQPLEINLIVQTRNSLELKAMEIKRTKLDLDLFYEDDFMEVDKTIRGRMNRKNDKGIVLLHGLPGTGKTTYLRYLVGKIRKRVLFLSPSVAGNLMNPDFIELLIDNPDSVLIIEDAENIIMDRKQNSSSSVSNLLNISDGLLADFLNVQLICTFNSALTTVDSALMRKGRLIARYEFGKLGVEKARRLSDHLGFSTVITEPMTVAEIANPHEKNEAATKTEVIGFRLAESLMN